ncbi:MAG: PDZ domain-containing protein [Acidobacteriota bacterium]|nr:PDZ domain-containing protein [Acidobacteriota bacterium]
MRRSYKRTRPLLAISGLLCVWLAAGVAQAQVAEKSIRPNTGSGQWFWLVPRADLASEQVAAAFQRAVDEQTAYLDTNFSATVFLAKKIGLTKGKGKDRKRHPDRPEKADNLRIEAEWRTGYLDQYRGRTYTTIALDSVRSLDLHYLTRARERFPEAPEGRNWNVNILAGSKYSFFFSLEESARAFINAVTSALKQRGLEVTFSRFGLMWENLTAAQAADMNRRADEGVLITMVAVGGPGDHAGIRPLDVALEVNGVRVKNFSHFSLLLDAIPSQSKAPFLLLRRLKDPNQYPEQNAWNTLTVELEAGGER